MAVYIGAEIIGGLIGRQIITDAITDASFKIYQLLTGIITHSNSAESVITELDVINKIKYLEKMCIIIGKHKNQEVVNLTLESIHDMILKIKADLNIINDKVTYNKTTMIGKIYKKNIKNNLINLRLHCKLLDDRINLFSKSFQSFNIH